MATLIPETIRGSATSGEEKLARLLRRLPEDWTVYFEPRVGKYQPDFVILAPHFGLLVIEVKDWKMSSILSVNQEVVELVPSGAAASSSVKNPLRQADAYWQTLKDECKRSKYGRALLQEDGDWRGNLCFPVGVLVMFTGIDRKQVVKSPHAAVWDAIFTSSNTVLADKRLQWEGMEEAALVAALKPYFQPFSMRQPFNAHQIDVLRWVLFPESRLDVILNRDSSQSERAMEVLDVRQEKHARSLGTGHRILCGVAGSGKTVLLVARARCLALQHPEKRTLMLCYNKVLAEWLKARMRDCPSVTVIHFDGWAKSIGASRKMYERDAAFGARVLAAINRRGVSARFWDSVLIDEAQDFEATWFQCAMAAMRDPVEGDLVIVADGSQRLYKRNKISWKSLGIKAQGRTIKAKFDLDKNYRNTPAIAELAKGFSSDEENPDGINSVGVGAENCRRGPGTSKPTFVTAKDHATQVEAALKIAGRWLRGERGQRQVTPIRPEEIGIFYRQLPKHESGLMNRLLSGLSNLAPTRWLSDGENSSAYLGVNDAAIKVQTIHSSKGLQYKAVIVLWTDQLPVSSEPPEDDRRLLYVAITRAENDLVLLGNSGKGFTDELMGGCRVRPASDL